MRKNIVFPYGTHIYREPSLPIEELKKDMKVIKKLGFNMVKIQESWALDEEREGEINLSKVEKLIIEAKAFDLKIYFGVTMEQVPAWLWRKYPDCRVVYNTGEPHNDPTQYLVPADGKPGPCWDHPEVRKAGETFIEKLAGELGKYKNIIAWNVWQEVGFWPMFPGKLDFCYCPYTLSKFRKWLRGEYGSLKKLNETWKTGYREWEEIEPPRFHPQVPSWIDWRYYMDDIYLPGAVKWKVEAFKKSDPFKRPVFCHVSSPYIGQGLDWRISKMADFYGSSCYPGWGCGNEWDKGYPERGGSFSKERATLCEIWNNISLKFDYIRSASNGKEFWAAEFQGGPVVSFLHRGRIPSSEDIRRWVLSALSTGISGLSFWNHRAEIFWQEAYGFGLLDTEGETSERAEEAGRIAKAINKYPYLFVKGKIPSSEVAILINENLYHFLEATPFNEEKATSHLVHTIRGIYRFLWEEGIWVDFIESEEMKEKRLAGYKVIILPFPISLDNKLAEGLKSYLKKGGIVISECCPGRYDKYGFARKGEFIEEAEEIFGVKHKEIFYVKQPGKPLWMFREWSYGESVPSTYLSGTGIFKGYSIFPNLYIETYNSINGIPVFKYGEDTCGVMKKYGKGTAYLIGTFLGHSILTYEDRKTRKFLIELFNKCGVKSWKIGKLLLRKKIFEKEEAWFLINPTADSISQNIDLTSFTKAEDLLEDTINKDKAIEVPPFSVRVLILERGR